MRKLTIILLFICILMTGCQRGTKKDKGDNLPGANHSEQNQGYENQGDNNQKSNQNSNPDQGSGSTGKDEVNKGDIGQISGVQSLKLSHKWSGATTAEFEKSKFIMPEYKAKVKPYTIAKDLSNIENINQFSGFTKAQVKALVENGFVVLPTTTTRAYYVYDDNEYRGIPNFITADAVLHTYHQFYDKSLTNVEVGFLYEDLDLLTKQMLEQSLKLFNALKDEELKGLQEKNVIYFMVARMLMRDTSEIAADIPKEYALSTKINELAKKEFDLIQEAEGYIKSPLFDFDFDYSQFKVRGHYTKSEELGRYFKTIMWFGTAPLPLFNQYGEYQYDNTLQALLISYTTFLETGDICSAELWMNIYQPTAQYVGLSDDIDVFTMNNLRKEVFGEKEDPELFNDKEYYDKLYEAVKALPEPKIVAKFVEISAPSEKQFRYMGQRYILDSEVMQKLMEPIVRPYPSSLDVMGVLGSDVAEELLFNVYKPQAKWPEYEEEYQKLKDEISGYGMKTWSSNLYNGWIWSIQEALTEFGKDSGMPYFMTTKAWKYKSLNTALGSYTELKHDTVLYGKQSVAEGGGMIEYADYHYIEPNIPLYCKLLYLTDNTIQVLKERGMINDKLMQGATTYKGLLELLITCSIKELRNEMLTDEEYNELLRFGGILEWISLSCLEGITGGDFDSWDITDMLVTDVSTIRNTYLSLGTGYFDEIYVVIPVNGRLYLSRGSVYSHYEFVSDTRLTDEEWWELQGIKINHMEYGDYPDYIGPSKQLPAQPFWVNNFKTDSNNVIIKPLEVNWDNLTE